MNRERSKNEALALTAIFLGALVVWGLSMWVLKVGLRGPILEMVADRAEKQMLEPWLQRALAHPVEYDAVAASSTAYRGRPVLWTIVGSKDDDAAWFAGDKKKPFRWSNPDSVKTDPFHRAGWPYQVLGVVEKGGAEPLLRHLGVPYDVVASTVTPSK